MLSQIAFNTDEVLIWSFFFQHFLPGVGARPEPGLPTIPHLKQTPEGRQNCPCTVTAPVSLSRPSPDVPEFLARICWRFPSVCFSTLNSF